eukprot:Phypoly_transcript_00498.p1 GENE.Phypoly_transcript_00498~~Phypoly_transcript_00498.p1  ORF type:complete len:1086 (+),score=101.31 Phypoly_transcript_00498:1345-4602(+)
MYEIDTCGNYSNLMNAILFLNNPGLPESAYGSCYSFSNCSNVLVTYSDSHLSRKRSEPYTINVISVRNSTNFTINGLTFYGDSVLIENCINVTVSQCYFEGYAHYPNASSNYASGVWAFSTDTLVILNNTFFSNSGVSAGNVANLFVTSNTFNATVFDLNSTVSITNAGNYTITRNLFLGTQSNYAIFVEAPLPVLVGHGVVSDNVILEGTVRAAIMVFTVFNLTVSRNLVSGIKGNCDNFVGIMVSGILATVAAQFSDNVVENFYSECPMNFVGMQLVTLTLTEMNNNRISNFSVTAPFALGKSTSFSTLLLDKARGQITNTTVKNIYLGSPDPNGGLTLAAIFHTGNISMEGVIVQNLSAAKTMDCDGCPNVQGTSVVGVQSGGTFIGHNIFMSDFTAGDAGVIKYPTNFGYANGGDAIGFDVFNGYDVYFFNATFNSFKAGSSSNDTKVSVNVTQCSSGKATYLVRNNQYYGVDPYPLIPSYVYQIEAANLVNGESCLDTYEISPPTNATMQYTRNSFTISWGPTRETAFETKPMYIIDTQASDGHWDTIYSTSDLTYTVAKLIANTTYHARLSAVNEARESNFVYFIVTTLPAALPISSSPVYKEFSSDSITLTWTLIDDGGSIITGYTLQEWNTTIWWAISQDTVTSYKKTGLQPNTSYTFRTRAESNFGIGPWSENVTISTAARVCGDGNCDAGENCTTCYLDCRSCGYQQCPGVPECNGGECVSGVCECPSGRSGPACEFSSTPIVVAVNDTSPYSTISVGGGGDGSSSGTQFTLAFRDIQEINANGDTIKSFDLSQQKYVVMAGNSSNSFNETLYNTSLPNGAVILVHLVVVLQDSAFSFANQLIHVSEDSVKYSMEIWNWPFVAYNNKLKVTMESTGRSNQFNNDCVGVTPQTDQSDNLLWIKVTLNGVVLYGKFSNVAEIDSVAKVVQFSYNETSALIETLVPFFWEQAVFDPNFQVLLDPTSNDPCYDLAKSKTKFNEGKITGIVVGIVFGIAILVAVTGYILIRRRRSKALQLLRSSGDIPLEEQPVKERKPKNNKNKEKQDETREGEQESIIEKRPDMEAHTAAGTFKVNFE